MKKIACMFLSCILLLAMTACGSVGKSESATLTLAVDGITISYELEAENDIIQTITQVSTLEKAAFTYADVDSFEASFLEYQTIYDAIEGTTYQTESTEDALVETITLDVSNSKTLQALASQELLPVEGNTKRLSFSNTVEELQSQGWVLIK